MHPDNTAMIYGFLYATTLALISALFLLNGCSTAHRTALRHNDQPPQLFHTAEGERAYLEAYAMLLRTWPLEPESVYVPTRFGSTHVLVAGRSETPPLVLLHAVSVSSASWFLNVGPLSEHFRIYAVDGIGDCGRSRMALLPSDRTDYSDWLFDVFAALDLEEAFVLGHSYGGFLGIDFSIQHPEKVDRLVLLAPAASIYPIKRFLRFMLKHPNGIPFFRPSVRQTLRMQAHRGYEPDSEFVHLMEMVSAHCDVTTLFPSVYTREELGQIKAPTLLLIGDEEKLYSPKMAAARAQRYIPNLTTRIIPQAGHTLNMERPDVVNAAVIEFLTRRHRQSELTVQPEGSEAQ